jgi:hypothetical protein
MNEWSLSVLLAGLHDEIQQKLATARKAFGHPGTKGDGSESVWLEMLKTYLPRRYRATKGHVVDSEGSISDQIDVLIFDRQYSPFIFEFQGQTNHSRRSCVRRVRGLTKHQRCPGRVCAEENRQRASVA